MVRRAVAYALLPPGKPSRHREGSGRYSTTHGTMSKQRHVLCREVPFRAVLSGRHMAFVILQSPPHMHAIFRTNVRKEI